MKKSYIAPRAKSIILCSEDLIAVSLNAHTETKWNIGFGGNTSDNNVTEADTRQQSMWDTWSD